MRDQAELEALLARHGIPRRHLYPVWYRLLRRTGLLRKPPLLMTGFELFAWITPQTALLLTLLFKLNAWFSGGPDWHPRLVLFIALMNPSLVWLQYRSIRRRIGLDIREG